MCVKSETFGLVDELTVTINLSVPRIILIVCVWFYCLCESTHISHRIEHARERSSKIHSIHIRSIRHRRRARTNRKTTNHTQTHTHILWDNHHNCFNVISVNVKFMRDMNIFFPFFIILLFDWNLIKIYLEWNKIHWLGSNEITNPSNNNNKKTPTIIAYFTPYAHKIQNK